MSASARGWHLRGGHRRRNAALRGVVWDGTTWAGPVTRRDGTPTGPRPHAIVGPEERLVGIYPSFTEAQKALAGMKKKRPAALHFRVKRHS